MHLLFPFDLLVGNNIGFLVNSWAAVMIVVLKENKLFSMIL